ncbi:MAG: DUF2269 family protein [Chitinophagales bacterium]|nr:DUF2269 family protein [Bacteroidota bacterium]
MIAIIYKLLLVIHILSAILGLGPGFVMIYIVTKAKNMKELRHAYFIRNRLHIFVMIGGTLLLLSGLGMGTINPALFKMKWYVTALTLFLVALSFGPLVLAPKSKPIKEFLKNYEGEDIPEEYYVLAKKLFFYERIENVIFIIIILLMILKPY